MQTYTVYNVLTKNFSDLVQLHESSPLNDADDLFVVKDEILAIETFVSPARDKMEIRFTFTNLDDHDNWIAKNKERYDAHVELMATFWKDNGIKWDRFTTSDYYISEFIGHSFKNFFNVTDWKLTADEKSLVVKHLAPLGFFRSYLGNGEFDTTSKNFSGARFLKEQKSSIRRTGNSPKATKDYNFPAGLMAYYFDHAIDILTYPNPLLFKKFKKLCYDIEEIAEKLVSACNYSAVIMGHKDLGKSFALHSHRLDDYNRYTFTIVVRLSADDSSPAVFQSREPYLDNDPNLPYYYVAPELVGEYSKDKEPIQIPLTADVSILVFNASFCPHDVIWNDDVYLFFVYDHVSFREGVLDELIKKSTHRHFEDHAKHKQLLYLGAR